MKVERGLAAGDVMYHTSIKKTPEEAKKLKAKATERDALKRQRREEQVRSDKEQGLELTRDVYVISTSVSGTSARDVAAASSAVFSNIVNTTFFATLFARHRKRMCRGRRQRRRKRERKSFRGGKKGKRKA